MFNRKRTEEVFGYDLDLERKRRSKEEHAASGGIKRNELTIVDNCPECGVERQIKLRQSRKNKMCSKCLHNTPFMKEVKKNQTKVKSEETKQRMRDNHWSKKNKQPWNKGKTDIYSQETLDKIANSISEMHNNLIEGELTARKIKESCTKRNISIDEFDGFSAPEGTLLRQSPEGKAWRYDVMAKANFTCDKCSQRGGSLHAHHLNGFNAYPEQRLDPDNGVCLCESCHSDFHQKYGKGNNTKEQYDLFKSV